MVRHALRSVLVVLGVAASAAAQSTRPMSFEDVLAMRSVSDTQISPDGGHVAYVVSAADLTANETNADVWLVSTERESPLRLTTSPKSDRLPRWSPDGKWIAFVSERGEKPQLYRISPFGGEAERLTESKTGIQDFEWSPDGLRIAYLAEQEPTADEEQKKKDKDDVRLVDRDYRYRRLWVLDVASRETRVLVSDELQLSDPQWSPDGRSIAITTTPTPKADDGSRTDIWVVSVDTGEKRKLFENEGPDSSPRWSPDGTQIAFLSRDGSGGLLGQPRLVVVPASGGAIRDVAGAFRFSPGMPRWSADGRLLYFTSVTGTASQLFAVRASGGDVRQVSEVEGMIGSLTMSRDASRAAFTYTDVQHPADVHAASIGEVFEPRTLTDHNPQVRELALGRGEVVRWKGHDGLEVEGLLLYPVGYEPGRRYPLIVNVHGGPSGVWTNSFPASWANYGHVWAGRGWLGFYPNPRGSSGYGETFLLANVRDWGGGDYRDIQTGVDQLVARGLADPDRMGQKGWSYGGYMTAWTLTQTSRFRAVMVGAGLTNMVSMYSTNDLQRVLEGYFGAEPWDDPEIYWTRSAMAFIKQAKTPTLIMHGEVDLRVPLGQAQELYMGLRKNEVPVELAVYPREPHGLREPRHQLDKMQREYAWFAKHVLGEGATPSSPLGAPVQEGLRR